MSSSIKICNIPKDLNNERLYHLFQKYGKIERSTFILDKPDQPPHGYVTFSSREEAKSAKDGLNQTQPYMFKIDFHDFFHQNRKPYYDKRNIDHDSTSHDFPHMMTLQEKAKLYMDGNNPICFYCHGSGHRRSHCPLENSKISHIKEVKPTRNSFKEKSRPPFKNNHSPLDTSCNSIASCEESSHSPKDNSKLNSSLDMIPITVLESMAKSNHSTPPSSDSKQGVCLFCHNFASYQCALCFGWYCSYLCQQKHWPDHSIFCRPHLILPPPTIDQKTVAPLPHPTTNSVSDSQPSLNKAKSNLIAQKAEPPPSSFTKTANKKPLFVETHPKKRINWNTKTPEKVPSHPSSNKYEALDKEKGLMNKELTSQPSSSPDKTDSPSPRPKANSLDTSPNKFEDNFLPSDGQPCQVEVTWLVNPCKFWVFKITDTHHLEVIRNILIQNSLSSEKIKPQPGDICASLFMEDKQWYRALVLEVYQDKCKVFYVDYGNTEEVEIIHLRKLSPELVTICPQLAIPCQLSNIKPPVDGWNLKAIRDTFTKFASHDPAVFVTDIIKKESVWEVDLKNSKGESLRDTLLGQKLVLSASSSPGPSPTTSVPHFHKAGDLCPIKDSLSYLKDLSSIPQKIHMKVLSVESTGSGLWVELNAESLSLLQRNEELLRNTKELPSYSAKKGYVVSAFSPLASLWLRAQVIEVNPFIVRYLDFPAKEEVKTVAPLTDISYPSLLMYCSLQKPLLPNKHPLRFHDLTACRTALNQDILSTHLFSALHGFLGQATCYAWHHGSVENLTLSLLDAPILFENICPDLVKINQKRKCHAKLFDEGKFYVSLDDFKNEKETISQELIRMYNTSESFTNYNFVLNELVAFKDKNIWLRGCLLKKVDSFSFLIQSLDEATPPAIINKVDIRPLKEELCKIPLCAYQITLDEVPPEELESRFVDPILECEKLFVEILDASRLIFPAKLYTYQDNAADLLCINSLLIDSSSDENDENSDDKEAVMFGDCKSVDFPIGQSLQFTVHEISTLPFFGVELSALSVLDQLTIEINEYANKQPEAHYVPIEEEVCLALYSDTNWYRAKMVSPGPSLSRVLFLDYGNYDSVDNTCFCKIPPQFLTLPFQAFSLTLAGATLSNSPKTISALQKLVPVSTSLTGVVKHKEGIVHHIEISGISASQVAGISN